VALFAACNADADADDVVITMRMAGMTTRTAIEATQPMILNNKNQDEEATVEKTNPLIVD
jgi:hypothetical protein